MRLLLLCVLVWAAPVGAAQISDADLEKMQTADVVILGEIHDNAAHHIVQAELLRTLRPAAVVWEMLTPEQAAMVTPGLAGNPEALERQLDWENSGWPDFALYAPVFAAYPSAKAYGAHLPRDRARSAMAEGAAGAFGQGADLFGLTAPLPQDQQMARETLQHLAHCDALPAEMLPAMVDIQRLRDATLARAVLQALDDTGGPVAVITGNGHARRDWGIPVYLARVRPEAAVFALGQAEDGAGIEGQFDLVLSAPPADRPDPCEVFR